MCPLPAIPTPDPDRSPEIRYLKGGFNLGRSSVPFFSACLEARSIVELLCLPSQIPFDPERPIDLEELFQRELDEQRVEKEIVPYLKREQKLRFFNALTVVLMPLDLQNRRRLAERYPRESGITPRAQNSTELTSTEIGPILLQHHENDHRAGLLSWNRDLVLPVVLDGQHRLHAIRTIMSETGGELRQELAQSPVSVLFLILDEAAGFRSPGQDSVTSACREIFIALNKHAEKVPTSRLYLLDDTDLNAVAMRSILAERIEVRGQDVFERIEQSGRLPLALVDWRHQSAKFDNTPFLSSILALYDSVQTIAEIPRFESNNYAKAAEVVERLEARFDLGDIPGFDGPEIRRMIARAEAEESPFELPKQAILAAGRQFGIKFGRRIVWPLTKLKPYAELLQALSDAGVLGTELEPWLSFNEDERKRLVQQLDVADPEESVRDAWWPIKEERYPLAFQVVFQKAILSSLNTMVERLNLLGDAFELDEEPDEESFIESWIERFNEFVAPSLKDNTRRSAFYGAGIGFDGNIDFRKSRVPAIAGFISYLMLAPLPQWIDGARDAGAAPREDIEDWLKEKWDYIRPGQRRGVAAVFSDQGKNWRRSVDDFVIADIDSRRLELDEDERDSMRLKHGVEQIARVVLAASCNGADDDELA